VQLFYFTNKNAVN